MFFIPSIKDAAVRTFSSRMAALDLLLSYKLSKNKSSEILWNEPNSIGFISRCLRNIFCNLDIK